MEVVSFTMVVAHLPWPAASSGVRSCADSADANTARLVALLSLSHLACWGLLHWMKSFGLSLVRLYSAFPQQQCDLMQDHSHPVCDAHNPRRAQQMF